MQIDMKWFLIFVLISTIMLIAYAVSNQYRDRLDFYTNLTQFLKKFKLNISFRQDKVEQFISETKPRKQFKQFILTYKNYITTGKLNLAEINVLTDEEKSALTNIIINIGRFDANNEIKQTEQFIAEMEDKRKKAEEDKNKLCPLIIKLSLLFAIGLSIVLV